MTDTSQTQNARGRDDIAEKVIMWAGVGILIVSVVVIGSAVVPYFGKGAPADDKEVRGLTLTVFSTLVPMFGTWVGTVIAFYFARENYEVAAKSTRELVGQLGDDRLKQIPVRQVWIPVDQIVAKTIAANETEANVLIGDLKDMLNDKVSRVPVWDANKVIKYLLHESLIYKYLAVHGREVTLQGGAARPATLQDLLDHADLKDIATAIAFVGTSETLADAKKAMEGKPGCQDVFVTTTGQAAAPVAGWITNVVIAKSSKASA